MNAFIKLFQLDEDMPHSVKSASLQDGIVVLEEVKTVMKDIERNAYYRTGKRCPQGTDLAYEADERFIWNAVQVLQEHWWLSARQQLVAPTGRAVLCKLTTLDVEHFFSDMRTPSRPTQYMSDYATRRPQCILESVDKTYQSLFVFYTGP